MKIVVTVPLKDKHKELLDKHHVTYVDPKNYKKEDVIDADVIMGNFDFDTLNEMKNLKWVQLHFAGVGIYSKLNENVLLTNASGVYGEVISEYMLAVTLTSIRNIYEYHNKQIQKSWKYLGSVKPISSLTVLSLGTGDIGSNYAKRMKLLGAKVIGVSRTGRGSLEFFDEVHKVEELNELLPLADVVASSLPGTDKTYHLLNSSNLKLTKEGSILINVGRGTVIDTNALIDLQKKRHFKAVCLDVLEEEPLPENNELWEMEGVYITPHVSGIYSNDGAIDKAGDLFVRNLEHFLNGEELEHVVNKKEGY